MTQHHKPLKLELYDTPVWIPWPMFANGVIVAVGLFFAVLVTKLKAGELSHVLLGFVLTGVVVTLVVNFRFKHDSNRPAYYADRSGFRLRSGRMRAWGDFHGARVADIRGKYGKVGEKVQIKVRPTGVFPYRTAVVLKRSDRGQSMVDQIIGFNHRLEDVWAEEAMRIDLGGAPVVAARERLDRTYSPPVSTWQSLCDRIAGLLGRDQRG